jgi:predicted nucleic acid-binding protein
MTLAMIDTQVLQYLIVADMGLEGIPPIAHQVREWYETLDKEHVLCLSSLVLGEFLAQHPPTLHNDLLTALHEEWVIYPYNDLAALEFARLRYEHTSRERQNSQVYREIMAQKRNYTVTKQGLRVDTLILAHAVATDAEVFFTLNDGDFSKLAQGIVSIRIERPLPKQPRLMT